MCDSVDEGNGDDAACEDATWWFYKGMSNKGCNWVAKDPSRNCDKYDLDDVSAWDACKVACGECDTQEDDRDAEGDDGQVCEDESGW